MKYFYFVLLLISTSAMAQSVCSRSNDDVVSLLESPSSRLSFRNDGGLANGGVCWWHSRLQRSSAFLAVFRPELKRPTEADVKKILQILKKMNAVVEIPGFHDFKSFTAAFQDQVQKLLEGWQKEDGFINQQWIRGLSGRSELGPESMKKHMNNLFGDFEKSKGPMWVKVQIKGIVSHAFLVLDMVTTGRGFEMKVIDSNFPDKLVILSYEEGARSLTHPMSTYTFVPYEGFDKDLDSIHGAIARACN